MQQRLFSLVGSLIALMALGDEPANVPDLRLPSLIVNSSEGLITSRQPRPVSITVADTNSLVLCRAAMSIRGSSSARHPKKPYRLELQDENGDDLKLSLLGMPKESDWILYPAYVDKTMIRDVLAYELWRQMGYWAPRTRYVHLFMLTNSVSSVSPVMNFNFAAFTEFRGDRLGYEGVYILMEKIKRGKHRVNIAKLPRGSTSDSGSPTSDFSGGYIFKKDRQNNTNETPFRTLKKVELIVEEPKARDLDSQQHAWFTNHINEFEAVLFGDAFADPIIGYARYVHIDSFIDYHWMQELAKNGDGYWFSEFYHKDRCGKINIGPLWDFDMCFGNTTYNGGHLTNDWRWTRSAPHNYRWYKRMFKDPEFLQRYIDRWSELRANILSDSNILALIDRFAADISEAQKLNYQRWPSLGKKVGPVYFVGQTWEEEVQWLKDWILGRLAWIDSQDFPKPVVQVIHPLLSTSLRSRSSVEKDVAPLSAASLISCSNLLAMSCSVGSIFYTTNNTDPRVTGGHFSTNVIHYTSPIPITPGLQLRARVISDYGLWSAPALYP